MILGAGIYQVPLIKKAQEMGFETLVVSNKGQYPGIPLADIFIDVDTTDIDGVVSAAKSYQIDGVATTGTDVCIPAMGKVVDVLHLPGTGYEAACRSMDKCRMKQTFEAFNIPTAGFKIFDNELIAKKYASNIGFPVMVKATDSSGSRGITIVNREDEFESAWKSARAVSRSKYIIIEVFLKGFEFGAQAFVHRDEIAAIFFHGDTVTPEPYFTPIGHSMPTILTEDQQKKSVKVITDAVHALGLRDCISNVDLMLVGGEPVIIEMGARMGATCLPECISVYTGEDIYEHIVRLSLGEYPDIKTNEKQANACQLLYSHKSGTVTSLHVPDDVLKDPNLINLQWDISIGDNVRRFKVGPDRIGHIIVKADTAKEGERLVNKMASQIKIEVFSDEDNT